MMITVGDYFKAHGGSAHFSREIVENAVELLARVSKLLEDALLSKVDLETNPVTGTLISGRIDGGIRLPNSATGTSKSSHKEGRGIDIYDPDGDIDAWITDEILAKHGLYREHPSQTKTWCHLTTRPVKSGNRTFYA
jgi:hypothetical protein